MKYLFFAMALLFMVSCGDGTNNNNENNEIRMEDPARVNPPEQAIPDSATIQNDSLIVTDSTSRF